MTAEPPKKRAWFQLHLSTCVALVVVSGLGIWINVRPQKVRYAIWASEPVVGKKAKNYLVLPEAYPAIEPCAVIDVSAFPYKEEAYSELAESRPWSVSCDGNFGWPFGYALNSHEKVTYGRLNLTEALQSLPPLFPDDLAHWDMETLALNLGVWGASILVFGILIESLLRRRNRKRAAKVPAP